MLIRKLNPKKQLFILGLAVLLFFPRLSGQAFTGTIQGKVTDNSGKPVQAATVYLASSSLPGVQIVLTEKSGYFDIPGIPGGNYSLTVEKPGYKTLVVEPIILRSSQTAFLRLQLWPAEKEGEVTLGKTSSGGDPYSSTEIIIREKAILERLPLSRNLASVISASAYSLFDLNPNGAEVLVGNSGRNSFYLIDGVNVTDNLTLSAMADFDAAIVEGLETRSAGLSLADVPPGGVRLNIITKSGGNNFSGDLGLSFSHDSWNKDLWSPASLEEKGVPSVSGIKNYFEPFFSLGGRFWTDRAWFFLASRLERTSREDIFLAPYKDVLGQVHSAYDWSRRVASGFFKLTVRPIAEAQASAWVNLGGARQPVAQMPSPGLPFISTNLLDKDNFLGIHGAGHYFLDRRTMIAARAAYFRRLSLSLLQEAARSTFWSDDLGDRYGPLSGADYNAETMVEQLTGEVSGRMFVDSWHGLTHILRAGFSYLQTTAYMDWWRQNNLLWFLDHRQANNNFFPDQGLVAFWVCGPTKSSTIVRGQNQRLGGYVSDTIRIGQRLTMDFSLRLDRTSGGFRSAVKTQSGNPLSYFIGEAYIKPYTKSTYPEVFPAGLNPWANLGFGDRGDFISWLSLSPRLGLVLNLWGDGKTLLKGTMSRYHDELTPAALLPLHPLYPGYISFFWLDANGDGEPDQSDEFTPLSFDFRSLSDGYFEKRVAADLRPPAIDELTFGLEHHINPNLALNLRLISRHEKNIPADVLYDPDSGETWYEVGAGKSLKYWLPFTTTVPGSGDYPAENVTFFVRSAAAPPIFRQWRNVPGLERKYRALEMGLEKRLTSGWGMAATLILSRAEGNAPSFERPFSGGRRALIDPNYFLNRSGQLEEDRPVLFKLQAAVELPWGFCLSAFYQYQSGQPWTRKVRILPPLSWSAAEGAERIYYSVYLEPAGARRQADTSSLDLRVEKGFGRGKKSRVYFAVDVLNLLGNKRVIQGLNDVDIWEPRAEGLGQPGKLFLQPDYEQTLQLLGKRTLRFNLRLAF